jgi:hypothetical protein
VKTAAVQKDPTASVTDLIPTITTSVGGLAKDKIDKALDNHPNVKETVTKVMNTVPLAVEAVKEVASPKND